MTRHSTRVYLTVFLDDFSCFVVSFSLATHQRGALVTEALMDAVSRFGKPKEVLTDQGRQYFAWRGKSDFQRLLVREGIERVVSRTHHPETLGKCERLWETINREFWERARPQDLGDARERRRAEGRATCTRARAHRGAARARRGALSRRRVGAGPNARGARRRGPDERACCARDTRPRTIGMSIGRPAEGRDVVALLERTAAERGAWPLLLAMDNGPENKNAQVEACLRREQVIALWNLPRTPQHNPRAERGFADLKCASEIPPKRARRARRRLRAQARGAHAAPHGASGLPPHELRAGRRRTSRSRWD